MNYGADAADQIVRYSMDGVEHILRISGAVAKNLAIFIAAVMKDQKKTKGKTRMVRMLKEKRPLKFFTVPDKKLRDFARAAKARGLLYVIIKDKKKKTDHEIMVFADDAAKMNRVLDKIGIDYAKAECGQAEFVPDLEKTGREPSPGERKAPEQTRETAMETGEKQRPRTQKVEMPEGTIEFEVGEDGFEVGEAGGENFTQAREEKDLSGTSSRSKDSSSGAPSKTRGGRRSVRKELKEIKQEQAKKRRQTTQRQKDRQSTQGRRRRKAKGKGR